MKSEGLPAGMAPLHRHVGQAHFLMGCLCFPNQCLLLFLFLPCPLIITLFLSSPTSFDVLHIYPNIYIYFFFYFHFFFVLQFVTQVDTLGHVR